MNSQNMQVLTNTIGAVESGGQVYGKRRYDAYTPPYTNTQQEHTITLGWAQNYGPEAKKLIQMIYDISPANFRNLDPKGVIYNMLDKDWIAMKWNPAASQKNILISLIDSGAGHTAQDTLFQDYMRQFIKDCEADYTKDIKAIMMYCEIRHLGGKGPVDRIFRRCSGNYSLDNIMASLKKDQDDKSSDNQVGDKKFWSRHEKCYEFINAYAIDEDRKVKTTIVDEFMKYLGTKEYNGIVETIQRWYYGSLVKDAWCATSTSYFANVAGILDQIGGKHEGVYEMMRDTKKLHEKDGRFWEYPNIPYNLKKHDIIFFQRNGMSHVAHLWKDEVYTGSGTISVLGGNQSDSICKKDYKQAGIQAVYRPDYGTDPVYEPYTVKLQAVKRGDNNNSVLLMQEIFRSRSYKMKNGNIQKCSGECGPQTEYVIQWYRKQRKLPEGKVCDAAMWRDLLGM